MIGLALTINGGCRWVVIVPFLVALPIYLAIYQDAQLAIAASCILFGLVIMPPSQVNARLSTAARCALRLEVWNLFLSR